MLAILTTHPIQYQVPIWQALARDGHIPFEVWYLTQHGVQASHDEEFGKRFSWDIDLLSGYPHRFLTMIQGATPTSFTKCRLAESLGNRLRSSGARALWVQGWQVLAYWQAVREAKRCGVQVWLRGESNDLRPTSLAKRLVKHLLLGRLFRQVDAFLYIGTANRRLYENFGVAVDRLFSTPYAVDNDRFARQAENFRQQRSAIRKEWGIDNNSFCVLFCGKFIRKKRPMDLVIAGQQFQRTKYTPNIHLLFVGAGELGANLRGACHTIFDADSSTTGPSTLRNNPNLPLASFTGFLNQTEISKAYVAADCLVLPSEYGETWGLVVNEAMASGLSCIISDQCGCAEDLGKLHKNSVFPCGNPVALAQQLISQCAASDDSPIQNGRFKEYSFSETVSTVRSLYSDVTRTKH